MNVSRSVCPFVFALALSAPAWAQELPVEGGSQNMFKIVADDFKNFFSNDTAKVMSGFAIAAVATAPWGSLPPRGQTL